VRRYYRPFLLGILALISLAGCVGSPRVPPIDSSGSGVPVPATIAGLPGPPPTPIFAPAPTSTLSAVRPTPTHLASATPAPAPPAASNRTVFVIVMENHNWAQIAGSKSAPYLNGTLLPAASYATHYYNPPGIHPSEPNYLWLEAGTNFGIRNDNAPATNHQATKQHLVSLLTAQGLTWKAYQEGISGTRCPLSANGLYAPKHNPMVFFDDVTNHNSATSASCIAHERPYTELAAIPGWRARCRPSCTRQPIRPAASSS
jgi:hypothetical protein